MPGGAGCSVRGPSRIMRNFFAKLNFVPKLENNLWKVVAGREGVRASVVVRGSTAKINFIYSRRTQQP